MAEVTTWRRVSMKPRNAFWADVSLFRSGTC
ncbi:hypothetical protein [Marinobacter sp. F4218]|nr:hypothetical protein [Marinobacter sp. F4218]